ncbi:MAG: tripartite tricarboxylate transporter substrate binding protein [Burkholderiaceae bacterium]|nr:tripartite tricarboxylate transporter substrate binding protein [Burkholderiaceae bacterium]
MSRRRMLSTAIVTTACAVVLGTGAASAQEYPARPIRLLVGFAAGGGADAIARTIATRLGEQMGQSVVVENRPGASSTVAGDVLSKAPADGYTLMLADSSLLIAAKAMHKVSFDPLKSFDPIGSVAIAPLTIAVNPATPIRTLEEMAEVAKSGKDLIYATSGVGTVHHLAVEYLQAQAKIRMVHLPYRGASQILPDLIGGQIPVAVVSAAAALAQEKAGKIRVIGLTSPHKLRDAPHWRPIADWLPGFDASPRLFLLAPAGSPQAALRRLEVEARKALADPAVIETLTKQGVVPAAGSSDELARDLRAEVARWEGLVRQANITLQ